ncbi:unnamed protein product, partial [Dovyalis caffra]
MWRGWRWLSPSRLAPLPSLVKAERHEHEEVTTSAPTNTFLGVYVPLSLAKVSEDDAPPTLNE